MSSRSRSDVVWQPVKPRRRGSLLLLGLAVGIAFVGHMYGGLWQGPRTSAVLEPDTTAGETPAGRPAKRDKVRSVKLSTAPRENPLPRQGARARRAPSPRGEVREAAIGGDR